MTNLLWLRGGFPRSYLTENSMKIALEDLKLDHLYIVYPGNREFPMTEKITALGLNGS